MSERRCIVVNTHDERRILSRNFDLSDPDWRDSGVTILIVGEMRHGARFDVIDYRLVHVADMSAKQRTRYYDWRELMLSQLTMTGKVLV